MRVSAQLNNLRMAPRKVRLVAGLIRGKEALIARQQLDFLTKRAAGPLSKLLQSALKNAEHNFNLPKENLLIKDLIVNEGRKMKRFRPKAMGQAGPIQKKTSRVKIILEEKVPGLKANKKERAVSMPYSQVSETSEGETIKPSRPLPKGRPDFEVKSDISKKGVFGEIKNIGRKLFRRKSI